MKYWKEFDKLIHLKQLITTVDFNNDCIIVEEQSFRPWNCECNDSMSNDNKSDTDVGT